MRKTRHDVLVARTADIDIRYERRTDRVFICDHMTGDMMIITGTMLEEAQAAIEVYKHLGE